VTARPGIIRDWFLGGMVLSVLFLSKDAGAEKNSIRQMRERGNAKTGQLCPGSPFEPLFKDILAEGRLYISANGKEAVFQDHHKKVLLLDKGRRNKLLSDEDGGNVLAVTNFGGMYLQSHSSWSGCKGKKDDLERVDTQTGQLSIRETLRHPVKSRPWIETVRSGAAVDETGRYVTAWGRSCCDCSGRSCGNCDNYWQVWVFDDCATAAHHRPLGSKPNDASCARDALPAFLAKPGESDLLAGRSIIVESDVTNVSHAVLVGDRLLTIESVGNKTALVTRNLADEKVISRLPIEGEGDYRIAGSTVVDVAHDGVVTIIKPSQNNTRTKLDLCEPRGGCQPYDDLDTCYTQSRVMGKYVAVRLTCSGGLWVIDAEAGHVVWKSEDPGFIDVAVSATEVFVVSKDGVKKVANLRAPSSAAGKN
jgi:hypothetical protein